LDEDEGFIQAIIADPDDVSLRLIYADWLDERDDPRGEYLRLQARRADLTEGGGDWWKLIARLRELQARISPDWLARLDRTPVENCDLRFEFLCPRKWEELRPTEDAAVRSCDACKQNVYHCRSLREAREHARQGHCIAVDSSVDRSHGDLTSEVMVTLGTPRYVPPPFSAGDPVSVTGGKWRGRRGVAEGMDWRRGTATVSVRFFGIPWRLEIRLQDLRNERQSLPRR
jgi:uncharacterized protein (TIGR02996 family)